MRTVFSFGFIILCCSLAPYSEAQQLPFGNQVTEASLLLKPAYPEPGEEVVASLNIYAFDTLGSTIAWLVDGVVSPEATDKMELALNAPALGKVVALEARVKLRDGQIVSIKHKLTSGYLDVVIEALTHTPIFYQGGALGSAGSPLRVTAIPFFGWGVGNLTYTWKVNNKVLFGGPTRGRQTIALDMPSASSFLTVTASNQSGVVVGNRTIKISPTPVKINFYKDNPLRGQSRLALPKRYTLVGNESTISAEPYYANTEDTNVLEEWRLNGKIIDAVGPKTRALTLTTETSSGSGRLSYMFQSLIHYTQRASKKITVLFNQTL